MTDFINEEEKQTTIQDTLSKEDMDKLQEYFKNNPINDTDIEENNSKEHVLSFDEMFKDIEEEDYIEETEEEYDESENNENDLEYFRKIEEEKKRELEEYNKKLDNCVFFGAESKDELTTWQKWAIKHKPEKFKMGRDPREYERTQKEKKAKKKYKKMQKEKNLSPEEKAQRRIEKQRRKNIEEYNRQIKPILKAKDKKNIKKESKLERKIRIAYRKQMRDQMPKYKNIKELILARQYKKFEDELGIKEWKRKGYYDPHARYRKTSNIITVAEAQTYEKDFKASFIKNLEMELMDRLNDPINTEGQTIVEYYDKHGRLKGKEVMNDNLSKKKKKKLKEKEKKRYKKYVKSVLSPNYDDF